MKPDSLVPPRCQMSSPRMGLAGVLLAMSLATSGCVEDAEDEGSVKIGVLLPFTGEDAGAAANFERAAMMVVESVNAAGGVFSPSEAGNGRLELITLDTASSLSRTSAAVDRLLGEGVVAIVGPETSSVALSLQMELEREQIVFVSPLVSSGIQPQISKSNAWYRFGPSTVVTGRAMAYDALDAGFPRLAIIHSVDDYHGAIAAELADRLTREGGEVVEQIPLRPGSLSYPDEVRTLIGAQFDAVALIAPPKAAAQVVNEVDFLSGGVSFQYFLPPSLETDVFLRNTRAAALEGARGIRAETGKNIEFEAQFRDYAGEEAQAGSYFFYDAMMVLSLALATSYHFEFGQTPSGRDTVLVLDSPRTEIPYDQLIEFVRYVSDRNGIRMTWSETQKALDTIRTGESVFYQGLTGTMVQGADGQRTAAGTQTWTVRAGKIDRMMLDAESPGESSSPAGE